MNNAGPYKRARELFKNPNVIDPETVELVWSTPDEEAIVTFMVTEKGFNEDRIRKSVQKLTKLKTVSTQGRLDGFFKVLPKDPEAVAKKRKVYNFNAG